MIAPSAGALLLAALTSEFQPMAADKDRVDELVSGGNGEYFDPGHGRLMKEWVTIGPGAAPGSNPVFRERDDV